MGITYAFLLKYPDALEAIQQTIRLRPNDANAHYWLGWIYLNGVDQYEKAVPAYREALRLKPNDANVTSELGSAYLYLQQYLNGVAAFKEAISAET